MGCFACLESGVVVLQLSSEQGGVLFKVTTGAQPVGNIAL